MPTVNNLMEAEQSHNNPPMNGPGNDRTIEETHRRLAQLERRIQVEEALEHVRARTMAMHHSDELSKTVKVLFEQVERLGIKGICCGIHIRRPGEAASDTWTFTRSDEVRPPTIIPHTEDPVLKNMDAASKKGEPLYVETLEGEAIQAHAEYMLSLSPQAQETYDKMLEAGIQLPEKMVFHSAYFSQGWLVFITTEPCPENWDLFIRFAQVFDQTYTRFLDLKKAEAQAHEAQIEAALERVRARTMAMHHSDELAETASILFEQLVGLGIKPWRCGFATIDEASHTGEIYLTTSTGETNLTRGTFRFDNHPIPQAIYEAWKRGDIVSSFDLSGKDLQAYVQYLLTDTTISLPEWKSDQPHPTRLVFNYFNFSHGVLNLNTCEPLKPEFVQILHRFTRVFDQTYTRFLDLQKAEAQAREAQIEAALERVRARAMTMHRSDELREVVSKVFEEFQRLDFEAPACCIGIFDETTRSSEWWVASASETLMPQSYRISYLEDWPQDWYKTVYNNWQQGIPFFACSFEGEDKRALDHKLLTQTEFALTSGAHAEDMVPLENLILSYATLSHGVVEVGTTEPIPEDQIAILQRFAKVIDLTYTRFDDLQQAEARALEAVRQASLNRLRGEIASMRTTDDLQRITPLIWRELTTLGVPFFRCGVFIVDSKAEQMRAYLTTPDGKSLAVLNLPFDSSDTTQAVADHWQQRVMYREQWNQSQFMDWMNSMLEQGLINDTADYQGLDEPPGQLALQFVPFTQGMLYVGSAEPLTENQIDLVQSLADTFAVAYARYDDFRQLEAALAELKATQNQLIHSEKMASLGQMTAGIAHEIKNPLNFVNNFAELMGELVDELKEEIDSHDGDSGTEKPHQLFEILADLKVNAEQIVKHGKRADGIVSSMMQHASGGIGEREPMAINALVEEYVNLAYHGMRAARPGTTVEIERAYDEDVGNVPVQHRELGRVLLNLLSNAFDAVTLQKPNFETGFEPTVTVSTRRLDDSVEIRIQDNGPGIPENLLEKIFEPFFTTKPTGSGTGLGLSLSYDIITQGHGGTLEVESAAGKGATFVVTLPC